ncbi:hypothetical protein [Terrihalobacillus insolitus]|nr:hypothetical protein [Terrihalobacillus insolitus]
MGDIKRPKKIVPKKITRFTGETKMTKRNREALKIIRAIKSSLG